MAASKAKGNRRYALLVHSNCGFCNLLASRGFDYIKPFEPHKGCECLFAEGIKSTKVEGQNFEAMIAAKNDCIKTLGGAKVNNSRLWDEWMALTEEERLAFEQRFAESAHTPIIIKGHDGYSVFVSDQVAAEMRTRDEFWVRAGKSGADHVYTKPRDALYESERHAYDAMKDHHGIIVETIIEDGSHKNLDFVHCDSGYELKAPRDGKHAVEDRLGDAFHKFDELGNPNPKIVMSNMESTTRSDLDLLNESVRRSQSRKVLKGYESVELWIIFRDGKTLVKVFL